MLENISENNAEQIILTEAIPNQRVLLATRLYERLLMLGIALLPMVAIAYIYLFVDPTLLFVEHAIHEEVISVAILQSSFISYVTWRCYVSSGEPLLRWLTLSFLGFTLIYLPHGLFTRLSDHHMALFLLYGPVSRLAMAIFLLAGLVTYGNASHSKQKRIKHNFWLSWTASFLMLDIVVGWIAMSPTISIQTVRLSSEIGALLLFLAGIILIRMRRMESSMMTVYAISLAFFAQSSLSFIIAKPWNHMWWFAHFIFASGFTVLSYGVIRAFHTTRAFALVFSQEEIMKQLASAKEYAEGVAYQLKLANRNLEILAATDILTGLSNRRHFLVQSQTEFSRSIRTGEPLTVLALDLDHFKQVNDQYGHPAGDDVLKGFAKTVTDQLRPTDHIGRWGGEEFMVILSGASGIEARTIAERIREAVEKNRIVSSGNEISITVSIGLVEFPADAQQQEKIFSIADERLYQAKNRGRNCVADGR